MPGQVPQPAAPARPGRLRTLIPLAVAAVAVLFAFVSLIVAAQAMSVANDAKDAVAGGTATTAPDSGGGERTEPVPRESPSEEAPPPIDPTSSDPPELNEQTNYDVETERDSIVLTADANESMSLDVDEPQAYSGSRGGDLILNADYNGQRYLTLGEGVKASADGAPGMTPKDCYDRILKAPMQSEGKVPARQGAVICLLTSFAAAQTTGDKWRLARVEITGLRSDGAVTVEVTAWNIPR